MGIVTATGVLHTVSAREKELGRPVREDELEPLNWRSLQLARTYTLDQTYTARTASRPGRSKRRYLLANLRHDFVAGNSRAGTFVGHYVAGSAV